MLKTTLALAAAMAMVCARAEAAVYTFVPTAISQANSPVLTPDLAAFTLSISDTAVRSGSFTYDYQYRYDSSANSFVPSAVGDTQALQSFSARNGGSSFGAGSGPTGMTGHYFTTNLNFSTTGQIISGSLAFNDDRFFNSLTGSGGIFSGQFGLGTSTSANVTGYFAGALATATEVPEPATLSVLATALASCVRLRRRQTIATVSNAE